VFASTGMRLRPVLGLQIHVKFGGVSQRQGVSAIDNTCVNAMRCGAVRWSVNDVTADHV
jgi:hypothetical protein